MLARDRWKLIGWRLLQFVPVIVLATFIVFGLMQLVPGDIAVTLAGESASEARIAELRRLYGLDRPLLVQYGQWLWGAVQGDLGKSMLSGEPVLRSILTRFPTTLQIVLMALSVSLLIGVPMGILAALRPNSRVDAFVTSVASLGVALPNFWLAMLLVSIFALGLGWFPATGAVVFAKDPMASIKAATLPALALAAGGIAEVARQLRGSLVEVLSSQFVRTLHAKGLPPSAILWRHGLKNVSVNLLTVIGLMFNRLLGATVVIEAVFAIPGVGSMVVASAIQKDFPVIQGVVLAMVLIVITLNLVIDLLYTVVDPRVGRR
ncbi:MAG: ABC transporter permease [Betaproteobacteria bacterium]|jgi:peptide/nickel transport system permease protein|nr:ABC transporter permease [Betaproteobacteria bacterium]